MYGGRFKTWRQPICSGDDSSPDGLSLVAHSVKNPPATRETWVYLWVGKIPWTRAWQPTPVFLPGESPWIEEPGGLWYKGSKRVRHNWASKHALQSMLHPAARLLLLKWGTGNFPGGPVVKNLPCNAGDASSIPDPGTKIPHTEEWLGACCNYWAHELWSPHATTREARVLQLRPSAAK